MAYAAFSNHHSDTSSRTTKSETSHRRSVTHSGHGGRCAQRAVDLDEVVIAEKIQVAHYEKFGSGYSEKALRNMIWGMRRSVILSMTAFLFECAQGVTGDKVLG